MAAAREISLRERLLGLSQEERYLHACSHSLEIKDAYQLSDILDLLPQENRSNFAFRMKDKPTDSRQLTLILDKIGFYDRIDFAKEKVSLVSNSDELRSVLCCLPMEHHSDFQTKCPKIRLSRSIRPEELRSPHKATSKPEPIYSSPFRTTSVPFKFGSFKLG